MGYVSADFIMDFPAYKEYLHSIGAGDNRERIEGMKSAIKLAMVNTLTFRQRQVMILHYFHSKSITEIADQLSLNKSTVSRSLKTSRKKLSAVLDYGLIIAMKGEKM